MKTSLFIPCIPEHFSFLSRLIRSYRSGTRLPDQIVVVLSDSEMVSRTKKDALKKKWGEIFELIEIPERLYAGPCRQLARQCCVSDIIIYQDADDLPYNNRIERIGEYFEHSDIVALNHAYSFMHLKKDAVAHSVVIESNRIRDTYFPNGKFEEWHSITSNYGGKIEGVDFKVAAGPVSVRKEVLDEISWKSPMEMQHNRLYARDGEDCTFCMETLYHFNKSIIINEPLYFYKVKPTFLEFVAHVYRKCFGKR